MEDLLFSINAVAPLFILMALGYMARQSSFISDTFLSEANRFVFIFLIPLMLFQNVRDSFLSDFSGGRLIYTATLGVGVVIALSLCIVPLLVKRRGQCGSIIQGIYRSNFLIYGMPLATGMYGKEAAHCIAVLLAVLVPMYNIAAVIILSVFSETRTNRLSLFQIFKDIARNPLILGCVAGLFFGIFRIDLPVFVNKPVVELSAMASPLALFLLGGDFKFRRLNNNLWKVLSTTATRLIIVPLAAMLVFIAMGFRTVELGALLCIFATPAAVSGYIMATNMGCDGELSGQIVVLTTVGSCLSIFLFVFVFRSFGFL